MEVLIHPKPPVRFCQFPEHEADDVPGVKHVGAADALVATGSTIEDRLKMFVNSARTCSLRLRSPGPRRKFRAMLMDSRGLRSARKSL